MIQRANQSLLRSVFPEEAELEVKRVAFRGVLLRPQSVAKILGPTLLRRAPQVDMELPGNRFLEICGRPHSDFSLSLLALSQGLMYDVLSK